MHSDELSVKQYANHSFTNECTCDPVNQTKLGDFNYCDVFGFC